MDTQKVQAADDLKKEVMKHRREKLMERVNQQADNRRKIREVDAGAKVENTINEVNDIIQGWPTDILTIIEEHVLPLPQEKFLEGTGAAVASLLIRAQSALKKETARSVRHEEHEAAKRHGPAMRGAAKATARIKKERDKEITARIRDHAKHVDKETKTLREEISAKEKELRALEKKLNEELDSELKGIEEAAELSLNIAAMAANDCNAALNSTIDGIKSRAKDQLDMLDILIKEYVR